MGLRSLPWTLFGRLRRSVRGDQMRARTMALGILRVALVCGVALFLAGAAAADTLTLKDGRVIHGRYIGGTADAIQMDVGGTVQTFDVRDVQSLARDSSTAAPPPPPAPLPDAPAPGAITLPAPPPSGSGLVPTGTPPPPPPDGSTVT